MSEPKHDFGHAFYPLPVGQFRAPDHDDRQTKRTRGFDLGARAFSAGIAGDDPFDSARAQHFHLALQREWSARDNDFRIRERQRLVCGIDEPQEVGVLRFGREWRDVLPANRKKNPGAIDRQSHHRGSDVRDFDPLVAGHPDPWRALKRNQLRSSRSTCRNRVAAHFAGEGVRCVDNMCDFLPANIFGKPARSPETADADWYRLAGRRAGPSRVGINGFDPCARDRIRKQVCIACSAQNEGAHHA